MFFRSRSPDTKTIIYFFLSFRNIYSLDDNRLDSSLIWSVRFNSLSVTTPRYFALRTWGIFTPSISIFNEYKEVFLPDINITWHLSILTERLFILNHFTDSSTLFCNNVSTSAMDVPFTCTILSSANILHVAFERHEGKSLLNNRNNKGPRTDPCGTPVFISLGDDNWPFMFTICDLSERYLENHSNSASVNPYLPSLYSSNSWSIVSKHFARSKRQKPVSSPWLILSKKSL